MEDNNQALRLAKMMQNKVKTYRSYELALPYVELGRSKLKKLSVGDVLLLGIDDLMFVLIENENICATVVLEMIDESCYLKIINSDEYTIKSTDSKKYQTLKISLGYLQSRKLDVGYRIDITQRSLQDVTLIVEGRTYASGSLINVDEELAVKIDKVEK